MPEEIRVVADGGPKKGLSTAWAIAIIIIIVVVIGVGIGFWYFFTAPESEVTVNKPLSSPSKSASSSASPSASSSFTKTYASTSTCIGKFSFEYPKDWIILKEFTVLDTENGGEGGSCFIDIKFIKEDNKDKNIYSPLNVRVRAVSNNAIAINIDQIIQALEGSATLNELISAPIETKDITVGGIPTKQYTLGGLVEWYYIGLTKGNSYYQIELQDPKDTYKNDRGSKTGYETIVSTWKFL